jgi:beta-lactamase class A
MPGRIAEGQSSWFLLRRDFVLVMAGACVAACDLSEVTQAGPSANAQQEVATVERRVGGRIGVFAAARGGGASVEYRADERFALCSTFKWVLAAQVLARVQRGELRLDQRVPLTRADLIDNSPVALAHAAEGSLALEELLRAAIVVSDNTAGNLLLRLVGGPSSFTEFVRSLGDGTTRLDRFEPFLNANEGDSRDTTSPRAMVRLLDTLLFGDALTTENSARLLAWLRASETGKGRIRAGLPVSWSVGDKTGTGERGACNDVAVARPPGRPSMLLAVYLSDSQAAVPEREAAIAEVARLATRRL